MYIHEGFCVITSCCEVGDHGMLIHNLIDYYFIRKVNEILNLIALIDTITMPTLGVIRLTWR